MLQSRLKEERERLGLTQETFSAIAGAKRRTLVDWEKGVSSPTAAQMSLLAEVGVDVYYVLTGQRIGMVTTLSAREAALVNNYRVAPEAGKQALDTTSAYLAGGSPAPSAPAQAQSITYSQANHGNTGQVSQGGDIHVGKAKGSGGRK